MSEIGDERKSTAASSSSGRFGKKSNNMFFTRNVAHPRNLRFITGVAGSQICSIKEDQFSLPKQQSSNSASSVILADPKFNTTNLPVNYDINVFSSYSNKIFPKKKKERLLPPITFWASSGLVYDTARWKDELHFLASSVGLMTAEELKNATNRFQKEKNNFPASPSKKTPHTADNNKPLTSEYSKETGRLNETPKTRGSRGGSKMPPYIFCVENNERELWMLQVLCQILQTESMQDIQSWLVSAGPQEKDVARELIQKALQGLQESGRIEVDHNSNSKEIQVNLENIQDTVKRITESQLQNKTIAKEAHNLKEIVETNETNNNEKSQTPGPGATPKLINKELTPLQRLLSKSQSYDLNNPPKTAAVINDTKYGILGITGGAQKDAARPYTADLFRSNNDVKSDKKLSNKIIKELVNFVEVERQQSRKGSRSPGAGEKVKLFSNNSSPPRPLSQVAKVKVTKNPEKDAQVLTIED